MQFSKDSDGFFVFLAAKFFFVQTWKKYTFCVFFQDWKKKNVQLKNWNYPPNPWKILLLVMRRFSKYSLCPPPLINKMWIRVFFTPPSSLLSIGNINMSMLAAQKYDQKITNVILLHVYLLACLAALLWLIFKCWHSMDYPKQQTHHLCIRSIIGYRSYTGRGKTKILPNQKSHAVFDNFKKICPRTCCF